MFPEILYKKYLTKRFPLTFQHLDLEINRDELLQGYSPTADHNSYFEADQLH